jgi:hypothetical protein
LRLRGSCEAPAATSETEAKAYGGLAIVTELARICAWPHDMSAFELRWRCRVTQEREPGKVDRW